MATKKYVYILYSGRGYSEIGRHKSVKGMIGLIRRYLPQQSVPGTNPIKDMVVHKHTEEQASQESLRLSQDSWDAVKFLMIYGR